MSGKERKQLINEISSIISDTDSFLPKKKQLTRYIFNKGESVIIQGKQIILLELKGVYIPYLKIIRGLDHKIPNISVDTGAIKFVVNGADIMRPGVVKIDENVIEGSLVIVSEETKGGVLCIGISLYDAVDLKAMKNGKCIKNLHHLKDKYWDINLN